MSAIHEWADLAESILTHDRGRELSIWRDLLCIDCQLETVIPGGHTCAECYIAEVHRQAGVA